MKLNKFRYSGAIVLYGFECSLIEEVKSKQDFGPTLVELKALVKEEYIEVFSHGRDGIL